MTSIYNFVNLYRQNRSNFGIPEFQRNYTWKDFQIESFFDSLLRKYPIPRFFTWRTHEVPSISLNYFSTNFDGRNRSEPGEPFLQTDYQVNPITVAICDGQQRLTSLLIGIQGYNISSKITSKFIYYNLFTPEDDLDSCKFKILSEADALLRNEDFFYIKVSDLYNICHEFIGRPLTELKRELVNRYSIEEYFSPNLVDLAKENTNLFREAIMSNCLDFVEINDAVGNDLSKAVQFFMRINNFGQVLTENQILFSLLSRYLQEDEFRNLSLRNDFNEITLTDSFTNLLKNRNKTYDFFLRCSLYVSTDRVLFKAANFNHENCILILNDWHRLKESIISVLNLMLELRLDKIIVSLNSIIPVIFHYFKKQNIVTANDKDQILIYLLRAQFSKVFGSHGDNLLTYLKNTQSENYTNPNYGFSFNDLNSHLPEGKSFNLNHDEINNLLELKYTDKKTRPILDLIYSNTAIFISYDIDHFHPQNICKDPSKLRFNNVQEGDLTFVKQNFDKLSNLQLLQRGCNSGKSDLVITEWINNVLNKAENGLGDLSCLNGKTNILDYVRDNKVAIPLEYNTTESITDFISIENFKLFYNLRKQYLFSILQELLGGVVDRE